MASHTMLLKSRFCIAPVRAVKPRRPRTCVLRQHIACPTIRHRTPRATSQVARALQTETAIVDSNVFDAEAKIAFLKEDLTHLFDDVGIDASQYDDQVDFRDPITKFDSLPGYLFNIRMLKYVFTPTFQLHDIKQTGPWELTSRWTMAMTFVPVAATPLKALWEPTLVFTGTSIYGFNPATNRINRHWDTWDSISDQQYFSMEGFQDMVRQMTSLIRPPAPATPSYTILQRRASGDVVYEVRSYQEAAAPTTSFNVVGGWAGTPTPAAGGVWAALAFPGGVAGRESVQQERTLREAIKRDGLEAGYHYCWTAHPDSSTPPPLRRNEVLIPLASFDLWGV